MTSDPDQPPVPWPPSHDERADDETIAGNRVAEGGGDLFEALVECWRCGKDYRQTIRNCPYCHAPNRQAPQTVETHEPVDDAVAKQSKQIVVVISAFIALLVCGLVHGGVSRATVGDATEIGPRLAQTILNQTLVFEVIMTVVVVVALSLCGRVALPSGARRSGRVFAWVISAPLLGAALGVNVAYHMLLRELVGIPIIEDELLTHRELLGLIIVLYCVQPAIVEELFSRYLFLGVLRQHMKTHGAVWVSAIAFGLMHLAVPLSIPYLIGLGAVLGYLRIASRSIVLPMLFHFAHNAAVIAIELNA